MGAIAEAFAAFAQPLIDQTDGSIEQLNKALTISQLCYNLALLPDDSLDEALARTKRSLGMEDEQFDDFHRSIILPMIERHRDIFPFMREGISLGGLQSGPPLPAETPKARRGEKYTGLRLTHRVPATAAKNTSSAAARTVANVAR